nr:hypothetical protein Iba_chr05cCG7150 [Ipomoea batatas]
MKIRLEEKLLTVSLVPSAISAMNLSSLSPGELLGSSIAFAAEGKSTAFSTLTVPSLPSSLIFKGSQGLSISTVFVSSGACLCNTTSGSIGSISSSVLIGFSMGSTELLGSSIAFSTSTVPSLVSSLFSKDSQGLSISTMLVSSGACLSNTTSGSSIAFAAEGNSTASSTSTVPSLPSSLFFKNSQGMSISTVFVSSGDCLSNTTSGSIGSISSFVLIGFSMGSGELLGSSIAFATEDNSTAFSTSTVPSLPSSLFFNDSQGLSISTICTLLFHFTDAFTYCDGYIVILLIGFSMGSAGHLGSSIAFATEGSIGSISSSVLIGFSMGSGELLGSSIAFATEGN